MTWSVVRVFWTESELREGSAHLVANVRRALSSSGLVVPAAPRSVASPPAGPDWLHEPKLDGWRCALAKGDALLGVRAGSD